MISGLVHAEKPRFLQPIDPAFWRENGRSGRLGSESVSHLTPSPLFSRTETWLCLNLRPLTRSAHTHPAVTLTRPTRSRKHQTAGDPGCSLLCMLVTMQGLDLLSSPLGSVGCSFAWLLAWQLKWPNCLPRVQMPSRRSDRAARGRDHRLGSGAARGASDRVANDASIPRLPMSLA